MKYKKMETEQEKLKRLARENKDRALSVKLQKNLDDDFSSYMVFAINRETHMPIIAINPGRGGLNPTMAMVFAMKKNAEVAEMVMEAVKAYSGTPSLEKYKADLEKGKI